MTLPMLLPQKPEEMTRRAQGYLGTASLGHGLVGAWMLLVPTRFLNLDKPLAGQPTIWAVSFVIVSVMCLVAAVRRSEHLAQVALFASTVITGTITLRLYLAWANNDIPGALGKPSPILWIWGLRLTAKDLIQCRQPLRAPFEPVRRQAREARRRRMSGDIRA
jgi:hypothetical protein